MPSRLEVTLPLLLLLLLLLHTGCSSADGPFLRSGWSVDDSNTSFTTYNERRNTECDDVALESHHGRDEKHVTLLINVDRSCQDIYEQVNSMDSFPSDHYEAKCFCPLNSSTNNFICHTVRIPVTVLEFSIAHSNASHRVLHLQTRLLPAGCAPVSRPPQTAGVREVQRLTGRDLRHLGQTVGSPILQPVFCPLKGSRRQFQPKPIYHVNIDANRSPRLLADAACICPGQVPVRLPISVMRRVSQSNQVQQEWTNIGMSCAVLSP